MIETGNDIELMEKTKEMIKDGRIDDAVKEIAMYLNLSIEENYIDRLENVIETVSSVVGGRTVIRFLIEHLILDIPSLLENISKRDSLLRYSFLLFLKPLIENESDLILPYSEDLINSDDPNVREAYLQLLIFLASGEKKIDEEPINKMVASKLFDEKDFVVQKAIQTLIAIGKNSPSVITRILTGCAKECPENEELKEKIDSVLKSIVTVDKIEEIVEEEKLKKEISEEEIEPKKRDLEELSSEELEKEKEKIIDKEIELKKKDLELNKKKLELEIKEKQLEEKEIKEKEKFLQIKEELLEKEKQLSQVELELKQKEIKKKEKEILEQKAKIIEKRLKEEEEGEK